MKSGNTCSLAEFFEKLQNDRPLLNGYWSTYAFGNIAKIWSLFSEVNAVLLPNESKSDNHSWELFLKSIDLNLKKEVNFPEEKINSSISLNTARLMRAISIRSEELGVNKREVARWFYNKFVLGSEVRGEKILPPENFKKALDDWNKNELSVLKDSVSSLICTEDIANDFENYDGSWLNKDSDVERVTDFDNEVAIHILNFFKNQSKR